ncbi:MAG TPA: OsmC family protein [Lysobacter sp.]|nr:OsmC family protein [Lysobacter sp.]
MEISARVRNGPGGHEVEVATTGSARVLTIPARASGRGSAVNGGELLALALATCYCNDLYREAERLGIELSGCEVVATAHFQGIGEAAASIVYAARIESTASADAIEALLAETDLRAEVHNTLRAGCAVRRLAWPPKDPAR